MAMTPEEAAARGPPELEISGSFTNFKVERKDDELQDEKVHFVEKLFVSLYSLPACSSLLRCMLRHSCL